MTDHVALVAALEALGRDLRSEPVTDIAPAVVARIEHATPVVRLERRVPRLIVAAAIVVVVATAVSLVRPAREAVADWLGIGDTEIRTVEELDIPDDVAVELGERVALEDARDRADFVLRTPAALDDPAAVYVDVASDGTRVSMVWPAENNETLPAVPGASVLLTEAGAVKDAPLYVKEITGGNPFQAVRVGEARASWIEGRHVRFGTNEPRRAAGNTLLWVEDGVVFRLETTSDLTGALETANSVREGNL
jgi:hypothetical protein